MSSSANHRDRRTRTSLTLLVRPGKPAFPLDEGYIETPRGIVVFYVERSFRSSHEYTVFETTSGGRRYKRIWNKSFRDRFIKTLANRFIDDVMNNRVGS